jgi:hypothetical protein
MCYTTSCFNFKIPATRVDKFKIHWDAVQFGVKLCRMRCWIYFLLLAPTICSGQIATGVRVNEVKFSSDTAISKPILDRCAKQIKNEYFEGMGWRDEATELMVFCLQDNGYFKATAVPEFQQLSDKGNTHHFALTFQLNVGHQYRIADVIFRGTEPFEPSELQPRLAVRPGDVFARNRIGNGLDNLRRFYSQRGYINFTPLPQVETNEAQATVVITVTLDAGRQYHVGGIEFSGVGSEIASKLRNSLELKKGEIYDGSKVPEFFRRNKTLLPKGATPERNFSAIRNDALALIYLKFDFVQPGYLRK